MKIGIDARMIGSTFGLARYVQQLVWHLLEIDHENEYVLFLRQDNWDEVKIASEENFENCESVYCVLPGSNCRKILVDIPWYSWKEQATLTSIIKREQLDLMHFPHWNAPLFFNDPFVATIHDLTMFHFPRPEATTLGPIKYKIKDAVSRIVINHTARAAKHILTTSEFTKADICRSLRVARGKITVTYQAPFDKKKKIDNSNPKALVEKYNLTSPYVLYVGAAYPHKNLDNLLRAWRMIEEKDIKYELILVGREDAFYHRLLASNLWKQNARVRYLGMVSDDDLTGIYHGAALYIIPSLYEGFGLPPLEAMKQKVPVVSSQASCLPEILGEAAVYFDPEHPENIADRILFVLNHGEVRLELRLNAERELVRYSWTRLAEQTLEVYQRYARGE